METLVNKFFKAAMRLDLFSQGDSVLLLGEGNFSFAKNLFTHNLPIKITATSFDNGVKYKSQLENIEFLMKNKIPVFLDVDATKLHEHPVLSTQVFSKVIFNFPHAGGKMKIQLNRQLLRKVCESSNHVIDNGGLLIISLCNGQGGTPADNPQRKWEDSWKVTEMAAYGSFCLISVEPFDFDNYPLYDCTGYRSQDSHFNLKGALVHVFKKKITSSRLLDKELTMKRLSLVPLNSISDILVPFYYSDLISKSPLSNSKSSVSFIKNLLLKHLEKPQYQNNLKILNDENISIAVESSNGVICKFRGKYQRLCSSAMQVMDDIVKEFNCWCAEGKIIFFPGMFFNSSLGQDFDRNPPISFQFVLLGENVLVYFKDFMSDLVSLFKTHEMDLCSKKIFSSCNKMDLIRAPSSDAIIKYMNEKSLSKYILANEWYCVDGKSIGNIVAHELHFEDAYVKLETVIIYVDKLLELFFCITSWKEIWSEDNFVCLDSGTTPILKQGLLYPLYYTFDITLKYDTEKGLIDDDVYEILRLSAIDMVKQVEMISEYNSCLGWSSKCFRITYQSLNEPLNKNKALDVHTHLISKMLTSTLLVTIK